MYAALRQRRGGRRERYLSADRIRQLAEVQTRNRDYVPGIRPNWRLGYHPAWLRIPEPPLGSIGHYGFGGSGAWADPETGLSFAFVSNRLGNASSRSPTGGCRGSAGLRRGGAPGCVTRPSRHGASPRQACRRAACAATHRDNLMAYTEAALTVTVRAAPSCSGGTARIALVPLTAATPPPHSTLARPSATRWSPCDQHKAGTSTVQIDVVRVHGSAAAPMSTHQPRTRERCAPGSPGRALRPVGVPRA